MADSRTPDKPTWKVLETIKENDEVTSVVIAPPDGEAPTHRAGQFASIRIMTRDGWSEPHPFTISCDAHENNYRFTIKNVGDFTAQVSEWQPGTPVQCSGPLGVFCKDIDAKEHIVCIAGGVGITPFLSVLRTFRKDKAQNKILLIWSNKTLQDVFCREELEAMTKELDLTVVHMLSREHQLPFAMDQDRVHYRLGRLTREILEEFEVSPTASVYVCGPPPMQEAVLGMLQSCGVSPEHVQREAFSFSPPKK